MQIEEKFLMDIFRESYYDGEVCYAGLKDGPAVAYFGVRKTDTILEVSFNGISFCLYTYTRKGLIIKFANCPTQSSRFPTKTVWIMSPEIISP